LQGTTAQLQNIVTYIPNKSEAGAGTAKVKKAQGHSQSNPSSGANAWAHVGFIDSLYLAKLPLS